jgi:hypothetical protein
METFGVCVSDGVIPVCETLRSIAKSDATMFTERKPKYSSHGDPAILGDTELFESLEDQPQTLIDADRLRTCTACVSKKQIRVEVACKD